MNMQTLELLYILNNLSITHLPVAIVEIYSPLAGEYGCRFGTSGYCILSKQRMKIILKS